MLVLGHAASHHRPRFRSAASPRPSGRRGARRRPPQGPGARRHPHRSADDLCLEWRCQLLSADPGCRGLHQFRGRRARSNGRGPGRGPAYHLSGSGNVIVRPGGDRWRPGRAGRWLAQARYPSRRRPDHAGARHHRRQCQPRLEAARSDPIRPARRPARSVAWSTTIRPACAAAWRRIPITPWRGCGSC